MEGFLVASAVHAIIAQRLLRRICEKCNTEHELDDSQRSWLFGAVGEERARGMRFHQGRGCPACGHTGYKGRAPVHEMLDVTGDLADALRNRDYAAFKQRALAQKDFVPLVEGALDLAQQGVTSIDEVIRISGWVE